MTRVYRKLVRAAGILFAEKGYNGVSVREICEKADITKGAAYYYIDSKEDLLYKIAYEYMEELVEEGVEVLSEDIASKEKIKKLGRGIIHKVVSHKTEITVCFREVRSLTGDKYEEVMKLHREYEGIWKKVIMEGARKGEFEPYHSVLMKSVIGMFFYSYMWIRTDKGGETEKLAENMNRIALKMLQY